MLKLLKVISPKNAFFFWGSIYFSTGTVQNFFNTSYVYIKGIVDTNKIN